MKNTEINIDEYSNMLIKNALQFIKNGEWQSAYNVFMVHASKMNKEAMQLCGNLCLIADWNIEKEIKEYCRNLILNKYKIDIKTIKPIKIQRSEFKKAAFHAMRATFRNPIKTHIFCGKQGEIFQPICPINPNLPKDVIQSLNIIESTEQIIKCVDLLTHIGYVCQWDFNFQQNGDYGIDYNFNDILEATYRGFEFENEIQKKGFELYD